MNGSEWTEYEDPILLDAEGEYNFGAQAFLEGLRDSDINGETFTLSWLPADPPQFDPGPGTFDNFEVVTISSTSPDVKIRYTYDGSLPTPDHGIEYTDPIKITSSALVRAVAYGDILDPTVNEAGYAIIGPAGGLVIIDKGKTSGDTLIITDNGLVSSGVNTTSSWRYLEVAPVNFSAVLPGSWAEGLTADPLHGMFPVHSELEERYIPGTLPYIGCGEANTNLLCDGLPEPTEDEKAYAAKACADFSSNVGGVSYSDWFLPSKGELELIAQRLGKNGLDLMDGIYHSSTLDLDTGYTYDGFWRVNAGTAKEEWNDIRDIYGGSLVRPMRMY